MKKYLSFFLIFVLMLSLGCNLVSCQKVEKQNSGNETESKNNTSEEKEPTVFLDSLTLDDERYTIGEFKKNVFEYKVSLPDGRPTVPRVNATAPDGCVVKISQAAIPDSATSGKATVTVTNAKGESSAYTVIFERSIENGFVLQYDDRWVSNTGYHNDTGDGYVYESSNPDIISIDENGILRANKVSDEEVTLTAKQGTAIKATLVVDRVEKAHINLFFITGQSNGQGHYDSSNWGTGVAHLISHEEQLENVEEIGGEGRVYSYDVFPRPENKEVYSLKGKIYDMATVSKQGHQNSLGKTYYELSGEKVVFLQSSYGGAPIESWLDIKRHKDIVGSYDQHYFYAETRSAYNKLVKLLEENYEIVCTANFWCQGETAMTAIYDRNLTTYLHPSNDGFKTSNLMTDEKYYNYFMMMHEDMKEDFGLEYNCIMFVRSRGGVSKSAVVPIISAQFALCNNNDDIIVATRTFAEIGTMYGSGDKNKEGYGFIGTDDTHYNQIGYNYHGKEAATNAFNAIFGVATNTCEGVEIIANNGIDRLDSTKIITLKAGKEQRIGALCLPHYINESIMWTSSDESVATVDKFGKITAVGAGNAVITATASSGKMQSVNVKVN